MYNLIVILALLIALPPAARAADSLSGPFDADVIRVVDGDTAQVRVHIWLGQDIETMVRLDGIDTPELKGRCAREQGLARQAKDLLRQTIEGKTIRLYDIRHDKYGGRIVARMALPDGGDIAALLHQARLAHIYDGGKRNSWC